MSKLIKLFASVALIVGLFTAAAEARGPHGGGWHGGGGGWHGGGGHWRGGGWGGWGVPYGYYYPGPYYYGYGPGCGWTRVRVWRRGHWVIRRAWRCW